MSTRNQTAQTTPSVQPSQPCDYCHQKPKYSNHSYCSKTCASQAATLCNHCHKKPKFQNFEYCGKNCASLAAPTTKPRAGTGVGNTYPKGNNFNATQKQQQQTPAFDPVQIAKLVVSQIPQVQALLNGTNLVPAGYSLAPAAQVQPVQIQQPIPANTHTNNPFLNGTAINAQPIPQIQQAQVTTIPQPAAATTNGTLANLSKPVPAAQQLHISTQPAADDFECLIPGCGKPVHVDAKGVSTSDYCSQRHREEAVTAGLVSPCIMCLTLPQSHTDYFCSKACKEESLNKHYDAVDQDEFEDVE